MRNDLAKHGAIGTRFFFIIAMVWLNNCAFDTSMQIDQSTVTTVSANNSNSCLNSRNFNCAEPSPFRTLITEASKSSPELPVHYVTLIDIGEHSLLARVHMIRAARKSIFIQQHIWVADASGMMIFRELYDAARRGVEVKVIGDQLNMLKDADLMAAIVKLHQNLQIKVFNPVTDELETNRMELFLGGLASFERTNQRMHNKLLIVDEQIALLGGRNHENKYFDRDPSYNFKDRDVIVIGPTVKDMVLSFYEFWNFKNSIAAQFLEDVESALNGEPGPTDNWLETTWATLPDIGQNASNAHLIKRLFVDPAVRVNGRVAFYADPPKRPTAAGSDEPKRSFNTVSQGIATLGKAAENEIVIQTPYLIFREEAYQELRKLHQAKPQLQFLASTNSLASIDVYSPYAIMLKQRRRMLLKLDMRIFELKPSPGDIEKMIPGQDRLAALDGQKVEPSLGKMPVTSNSPIVGLHAKSIVVDSRIAFIGTHNFDPRSATFNTELALIIWDSQIANAVRTNIVRDMAPQNSWVVARQKEVPLIYPLLDRVEAISRALPTFDLWPFRYSASFELRDGETQVSPHHAEFYDRYKNVGQFPHVKADARTIQTKLFGALMGFAAPLL